MCKMDIFSIEGGLEILRKNQIFRVAYEMEKMYLT